MRKRASKKAAGIVLLLIMLVAAGYLIGFGSYFVSRSHNDDSKTKVACGTPFAHANSQCSQQRTPRKQNLAPEAGTPMHQAPGESALAPLRFSFVEGSVVAPAIEFRYQLRSAEDFKADVASESAPETTGQAAFLTGRADSEGRFEVPTDVLSKVRGPVAGFRITLTQVGWQLASKGQYPGARHPNEFAEGIVKGKTEYNVPVYQSNSVFISVRFEDGQSFEGEATVTLDMGVRKSIFRRHSVKSGDSLQVDVPKEFVRVEVMALANRRGFALSAQKLYSMQELQPWQELVIPRDRTQNSILVHLDHWPIGEIVSITFRARDDQAYGGSSSVGGETWETFRVPRNDWLFVEVQGPSGVWRSELIRVGENEKIDVYPEPTRLVTYVVKFVDVNGVAVLPAQLSTQQDSYPDWWWIKRQPPTTDEVGQAERYFALAGTSGKAVLTGIMPGKRTLVAEAFGFEPVVYDVDGKPGQTVDLGTVKLAPAKGRVEIRLVGARRGVGYYVWLRGPESRGIVDLARDVTTDLVVFEKVAVRAYSVHVAAGNGARGKNIAISFPPGVSVMIVDVDVSDLEMPSNEK